MAPEGFVVTLDKDRAITVGHRPPGSPPYPQEVAKTVAKVFNENAPNPQKGPWVPESVGEVPTVLDEHRWLENNQDIEDSL